MEKTFFELALNKIHQKLKLIAFMAFFVFLVSLVMQVYFTNKLAVKGKKMVELSYKKEELLKQISERELEKSSYTSLAHVETVARAQGFVDNVSYIAVISPVKATASVPSL